MLSALAGCRSSGPVPAAPTQIDRLIAVHPELSGGRFSVIADFEDPRHAQLLSWSGVSPGARFTVDSTAGRRETGGTAVRLSASSPRDTLTISNDHATDWYMRRDWRGFDLLLLAVQAPTKSSLRIEVTAGSGQDRRTSHTFVPLDRGWNQVRLDLADLAERVPIDDVRELRLGIADGERATELVLDDLILTASTEELFSDTSAGAHGLYARRVGRRLMIGATDRFELVFAGGQIVGWYDLSSDPQRLENLVRGTALGPFPMALRGPDGAPEAATGAINVWGATGTVAARQRLIEANLVRLRVEVELDSSEATRGDGGRTHTIYTIYRGGDIFVGGDWQLGSAGSTGNAGIGMGFAVASSAACQFQVDSAAGACVGAKLACGDGHSPLAIHWPSPSMANPKTVDSVEGATMVAAAMPVGADGVSRFAARLQLAGPGPGSAGDESRTTDGSGPPAEPPSEEDACVFRGIAIERGQPLAASALTDRTSGFDPVDGCVHVEPADGTARLVIDRRKKSAIPLGFAAHLAADHDAWVYVDGLLFSRAVRVNPELLVFQVSAAPNARTVVEVLTRQARPADDFRPPQ